MTRELNTLTFQEHGTGCFLDAQFGEKQNTYLMRADVALTALLRSTTKLKRGVSSLEANVPEWPHQP